MEPNKDYDFRMLPKNYNLKLIRMWNPTKIMTLECFQKIIISNL